MKIRSWQIWIGAASALAACYPVALDAQIRTDSSLGRAGQALTGPQFVIPETLGSLRGANLFHSFSVFNVNNGESATFTTATSGIRNVVSRVTGGDPSLINGALRLNAADGAPSFYFINPAGVTFGAGASIDVPGGFHVSTADYVKFSHGAFYANANSASTLSSEPPEAFGFLGSSRATVGVIDGARLTTSNLQPFSIVAGDIDIDNARVMSRGGEIRIVAVGARSVEIPFGADVPALGGNVRIVNGGQVSAPVVAALDGGPIAVFAGSMTIDRQGSATPTGIFSQADAGTTGNGGSIHVLASGDLVLLAGGQIATVTRSAGNAGDVRVEANNITVDGLGTPSIGRFRDANGFLTGIISWSTGPYATIEGSPGNVDVVAKDTLKVLNGGMISSTTDSLGDAGAVQVQARAILVDGALDEDFPSSINARADSSSDGRTGYLTATATERITLSNGGELSIFNGSFLFDLTGTLRTLMMVSAPEIFLFNGGRITADSAGDVGGSDIRVGFGSRLSLVESSITASSLFGGNSGSIEISGPGVLSLRNSRITTSIPTFEGNGGDIRITAGSLVLDTGFIQANTVDSSGRASAGNVAIDVRSLVPSGSTLFVGGSEPLDFQPGLFGFNVIQAAAPRGLSGTVSITTPALDISGSLVGLNARVLDSGGLARSPCESTGGSALVQAGRGGMPPSARGFIRVDAEEVPASRAVLERESGSEPARAGCPR